MCQRRASNPQNLLFESSMFTNYITSAEKDIKISLYNYSTLPPKTGLCAEEGSRTLTPFRAQRPQRCVFTITPLPQRKDIKASPLQLQTLLRWEVYVRKRGLEPLRPFGHQILSLVRLPITPYPVKKNPVSV